MHPTLRNSGVHVSPRPRRVFRSALLSLLGVTEPHGDSVGLPPSDDGIWDGSTMSTSEALFL